jgi:thiol-disulfide isomerase/thioredoxin
MHKSLRVLTILLVCCLAPMAQAKRTPNLEFKTLTGNSQKLSDLRGSITVVNFWATWCGPCQEELPLLSKLTQEYAGKKVRFIAISADAATDSSKGRAKIDSFLSHKNLAMEVWVGADVDMLERLGLGNVLPATMVLDEQGEIIARVMGQAHEEDLRVPLDWLLNGKSGTAPQAATKRY